METKDKLAEICQNYINEHHISCAECIWDTDEIIINAYSLIHDICETLGYYEYPEDDE